MNSVFVDVNIPMYAGGAEHPHKEPSVAFLLKAAEGKVEAVTDAEVFQEILHRYRALGRLSEGLAIYDSFRAIVPVVFSVEVADVDEARSMLESSPQLSSRDALHVAVMKRHGLRQIVSFDQGFDRVAGIRRIKPSKS